jgi:hypothetical protein
MRAVNVYFKTGGNTQSVPVDRDCILSAVSGNVNAVLSLNPTRTYADIQTPAADLVSDEFLIIGNVYPISFRLDKNSVIYISALASSVGTYQLFFDDIPVSA